MLRHQRLALSWMCRREASRRVSGGILADDQVRRWVADSTCQLGTGQLGRTRSHAQATVQLAPAVSPGDSLTQGLGKTVTTIALILAHPRGGAYLQVGFGIGNAQTHAHTHTDAQAYTLALKLKCPIHTHPRCCSTLGLHQPHHRRFLMLTVMRSWRPCWPARAGSSSIQPAAARSGAAAAPQRCVQGGGGCGVAPSSLCGCWLVPAVLLDAGACAIPLCQPGCVLCAY
jgi:hypothetical protein